MTSYSWAWLIIIVAGCVGVMGTYMLIRFVVSEFIRVLVCGLVLALLLTPAPVPGHPSSYAPAFIVAIFEGVLQSGGNPGVALRQLLLGFVVAFAAVIFGTIGLRRWRGGGQPPD